MIIVMAPVSSRRAVKGAAKPDSVIYRNIFNQEYSVINFEPYTPSRARILSRVLVRWMLDTGSLCCQHQEMVA